MVGHLPPITVETMAAELSCTRRIDRPRWVCRGFGGRDDAREAHRFREPSPVGHS
jgi:hypothetical protein